MLGAVLTGGASSRFGADKAAALWAGAALADHAAAAIAPFVGAVVRVGGEDGIPDRPRGGLGPLGGIAAALDHAGRQGFETVLTIACDMPRLPDGLVEALLCRAPAYCAEAPVLGHWPAALAAALIARLASRAPSPRTGSEIPLPLSDGETGSGMPDRVRRDGRGLHARDGALSIRGWATAIGAMPLPSPAPIANVNTRADLLAL